MHVHARFTSRGLADCVLDVMSAGLPATSNEVGELMGLMEPDENGLLAEAAWPAKVASVVDAVLSHPEWLLRASRSARQTVAVRASVGAVAVRRSAILIRAIGKEAVWP